MKTTMRCLKQQLNAARELNVRFYEAIVKHRAARGNDRCWLNDRELYAVLDDGNLGDNCVPPREEFLANCAKYYDNRCSGDEGPAGA